MIFFVGPLPPPVGGFSVITEKMHQIMSAQMPVTVFDRSRKTTSRNRYVYILVSLWRLLALLSSFFMGYFRYKPSALYLAVSGGNGQIIDLFFVMLARLFGLSIFIHHHSFAYLDHPTRLSGFLFSLANADHIVLCAVMKDKIREAYSIQASKIHVISNAIFLEKVAATKVDDKKNDSQTIVFGYISNITEDKGIFEYFSALNAARDAGFKCQGLIAGPVQAGIKLRFEEALAQSKDVKYIGSIYGVEKQKFYEQIDILLFPTKYVNEAEPVIIHEAMSQGVPTISVVRGCIASIIGEGTGCVASHIADYNTAVVGYLQLHTHNGVLSRLPLQENCMRHFAQLHQDSATSLSIVLQKMMLKK